MAKKVIIKRIKATRKSIVPTKEYAQVFTDIKKQVQTAQIKATLAANKELIKLYWSIGKTIAEKQEISGWGSSIIEQLAKDIQNAFPGLGGFSRANVFNMRAFYLAYEKVQQAARQFKKLSLLATIRDIDGSSTTD